MIWCGILWIFHDLRYNLAPTYITKHFQFRPFFFLAISVFLTDKIGSLKYHKFDHFIYCSSCELNYYGIKKYLCLIILHGFFVFLFLSPFKISNNCNIEIFAHWMVLIGKHRNQWNDIITMTTTTTTMIMNGSRNSIFDQYYSSSFSPIRIWVCLVHG